ncbi:MAG: family 10 glycosylhydrolase [Prevotella sp.]|nr:family 10 glycosylhydrolase [Prevotella sp.]
MKKSILILIISIFIPLLCSAKVDSPKREFRGAWLHVIGQGQWKAKSTEQQKTYIREQLDLLHDAGCNAAIFQVRPHADALYQSDLEPWSSWLTGKRGKEPSPMWDPLQYAIEQAHDRGMELHAWLNPYRVTSGAENLPADHISKKYPERFFKFDNKIFFDPAYQENRDFICQVVEDICKRYDVDAIHIDDYFYPYPSASGQKFNNDDASYRKFGNGMPRNDWRRHNVDLLIEQMHKTIKKTKPWVRFGVSPFGIWRNKKSDPRGSDSSGLQNYDDLYADVLLWAKKGWIDYLSPQLYWSLDTKAAPTRKLIKWWNDNANGVDIYVGYDVQRTMNSNDPQAGRPDELQTKMEMARELPNIDGIVWWHGYWVTGNYKGVASKLTNDLQANLAIPPSFGDPDQLPATPQNVRFTSQNGKTFISWNQPSLTAKEKATDPVKFVVYQFFDNEKIDLNNSETIIAITPYTNVELGSPSKGERFVVTSLDRMNRESKPSQVITFK